MKAWQVAANDAVTVAPTLDATSRPNDLDRRKGHRPDRARFPHYFRRRSTAARRRTGSAHWAPRARCSEIWSLTRFPATASRRAAHPAGTAAARRPELGR